MRRARSAIMKPTLPDWEQYTTPLAAFHAGKLNAEQMGLVLKMPAEKQAQTLRWLLGAPQDPPPPDGKRPAPAPSTPGAAPVPPAAAQPPTKPRRKRSEARGGQGLAWPGPAPTHPVEVGPISDAIRALGEGRAPWAPPPMDAAEAEEDAFSLYDTGPEYHVAAAKDERVPPWERGMNPEQSAVIAHVYGPLRVPAKAGTGKTRALVNRMARLIRVEHISGDRIAAFTFSKKAAMEMNKRLDRDLGITSCRVGTWHSLAMQVIREDKLPQSEWRVDEKDRHKIHVKEAAGWKHVDWKGADLTKLLSFIGWCKAHLWPYDAPEAAAYAAEKFGTRDARRAVTVYEVSDRLTHGAGLLTFDDMLVFVARHLMLDENAEHWGGKWDFVLCDEDQDTNVVQKTIRHALAKGHKNLMVVGDKDQSIFGFRGCSPAHFISFDTEWPGTKTVLLNRNYRSGSAIIDAANSVIAPDSPGEAMLAERGTTGKISVVASASLDDEATEFVTWVQGHVSDGHSLGSCTALFRTNAQSRALEEKLLSARIPYVIIGGHSFYERREIKDLLAYLRVAMGRDPDGDAVKRCINAPFRFLGAKFVDKVMDLAGGKHIINWRPIVEDAAQQAGIQRRQQESADEWCGLIGFIQRCLKAEESSADAKPATILNELVNRTKFIEWLEKEEGEESIESSHGANVRELIRVAERFGTCKELLDYIDKSISEQQKQRKNNEESDTRVTLMSIHRSKGLEWPHVWVVGLVDGILPHARGDMAEERRLAYVAITRGRDEVVLSWVRYMALKGGVRPMQPSPFLADAGLGTGQPGPGDPSALAHYPDERAPLDPALMDEGEVDDEIAKDGRLVAHMLDPNTGHHAGLAPSGRPLGEALANVDAVAAQLGGLPDD